MLRDDLARLVELAVDELVASNALPEIARGSIEILDTKQPEHGEFMCNFALVASKRAGMNPRQISERVAAEIARIDARASDPLVERIDIAGPGFLNFHLKPHTVASYLRTLLELGRDLPSRAGNSEPQRINVEFVSVNPNGPITVGSGRGAAFGDTLCRVLEAAGHRVYREYYVNDGVNSEQMRLFAESVRHYYRGALGIESTFPEKGYRGEYVQDVAKALHDRFGEGHERADSSWYQSRSQELMLQRQREDLESFGVDFDLWFSEQSLHDSGEVERCIDQLEVKGAADTEPYRTVLKLAKGGIVEEVNRESQTAAMEEEDSESPGTAQAADADSLGQAAEGAGRSFGSTLWLRSTKFGDDMDRVLRRRDGRLTYIASDVAYHRDKLTDRSKLRGTGPSDRLVTVLGPDHHGYIARLQAVLAALLETPAKKDDSGELTDVEAKIYRSAEERDACRQALEEARRRLKVVIFQIVRFMKDGKPAPMRKRDGNIYELRDLIAELGQSVAPAASEDEQKRVGADVARFFYLMRSHDSSMDFDIDLATKQSDDNPVFYVQYAHARICSVLKRAQDHGLTIPAANALDTQLLVHPREQVLIRKTLDLPFEVRRSAEDYGVHRLTTYAVELARTYHHFYDACRVIQPDERELSGARLALCEAARIALSSTLELLGISAPERMDREERTQ